MFRSSVVRWTTVRGVRGVVAGLGVAAVGAVAVFSQTPTVMAPPSGTPVYISPVVAPVVDGFRPPQSFAGPGNRGLQYQTVGGEIVAAAAPGTVVFAGSIAGSEYVTVQHDDGIRTSYSYLAGRTVRVGDVLVAGQVVGQAGVGFHLGARIGDTYLDPAILMNTPARLPSGRAWLISAQRSKIDREN